MNAIGLYEIRTPLRVSLMLLLIAVSGFSQQLLSNGDFSQGLAGWTQNAGGPCGTRTVSIVASDPPYADALEVASTGGYGCGGGSQVYQDLSVPVSGYSFLTLSADVKAVSADVGNGCGWNGLEYPIHLDVYYVDPSGANRILMLAFYFGGGTCGHPDGTWGPTVVWATPAQIPQDQWHHFTSPNLKTWIPSGSTITRVAVSASGWDYVGRADNVRLDVAPVISGMPVAGCTLWPPNHKMVQVGVVTASDPLPGLAPGSFQVTGTSNQPSDPKSPDIVIVPNGTGGFVVQLRAARLGNDNDRIYTLHATATDLAGVTTSATATCMVPHDQGK